MRVRHAISLGVLSDHSGRVAVRVHEDGDFDAPIAHVFEARSYAAALLRVGQVLDSERAADPEAGAFVFVCDLCGQPLALGESCYSAMHVGPDGEGEVGRPVRLADSRFAWPTEVTGTDVRQVFR